MRGSCASRVAIRLQADWTFPQLYTQPVRARFSFPGAQRPRRLPQSHEYSLSLAYAP